MGKYIDKLSAFRSALAEQMTSFPDSVRQEIEDVQRRLKIDYILQDSANLVKETQEGTERVRKIVQDLKSFSRVDQGDEEFTDIAQCLDSTINIAWHEIKYIATLNKEYGDIPKVRCFPQQINQVFMNLLVNAAHALTENGEITVCTWHDSENVFVSISDTGCGIPEEIQPHIFEPFFTTKENGKGTGLGLSISSNIIKKHGGDITLVSEPGKGTAFTVRLPICGI